MQFFYNVSEFFGLIPKNHCFHPIPDNPRSVSEDLLEVMILWEPQTSVASQPHRLKDVAFRRPLFGKYDYERHNIFSSIVCRAQALICFLRVAVKCDFRKKLGFCPKYSDPLPVSYAFFLNDP